jgi:nucleotide-binding universal stress UspA family protein
MGIRDTTAGIRNTTVSGRSIPAFSYSPRFRYAQSLMCQITASYDDDTRQTSGLSLGEGNFMNPIAGRLTGELHVIHTFVPTAFAAAVVAGRQRMTPEYSEALQVENSYRFRQIEHLVSAYGVTQEHLHVEMGTPEDCLSQTVTQYCTDVLVMGTSSHGRWHRIVVGSTAAALLESMPCDILIVGPFDKAQAIPC